MELIANIGELDELSEVMQSDYSCDLEDLLKAVLDLFESRPKVKTVTIRGGLLSHLTFQRPTGHMPSGVYEIYGNFKPGLLCQTTPSATE